MGEILESRSITIVMLTLLSISLLTASFNPQHVMADRELIRVPEDYPTIKQAVHASSAGDTIIVSEGVYAEGEVWITKPGLTLIANGTVVVDGLSQRWAFYVIADNVTIKGFEVVNSGWIYGAITLDHAHGCRIENNTVKNNGFNGIDVFASSNNTMINNVASFNDVDGICLSYSSNNIIINNTATNNGAGGIYVGISHNNLLIQNYVSNNKFSGMSLLGSKNNTLYNNTASYNDSAGVCLGHCGGTVMRGNTMMGNRYNFGVGGEYLSDFMNDIDASNLVDGKRVIYIVNQNNITVDPYTFPNTGYVGIVNSTGVTVKDLTLTGNWEGALLVNVRNSTIQNLNVTKNDIGIEIRGSTGNIVGGNVAMKNWHGIDLTGGSHNNVSGNTLIRNSWGIYLFSDYNVLTGNIATNNAGAGIRLDASYNNFLAGNTLMYNGAGAPTFNGGISLTISANNTIVNNLIANNAIGILVTCRSDNKIYHNNLIENKNQTLIFNTMNLWDDGYPSGGNYWSDYNGTDLFSGPFQNITGSDGIGDTPYIIIVPFNMSEDNQDCYPLMKPLGLTHDVLVLSVTPSTNITYVGRVVSINVSVQNRGELAETFNVTAYYSDHPIETQVVTDLAPGKTATVTFNWNTADVSLYANHTIRAEASSHLLEANRTDNVLIDGTVYIMMVGDVNGDKTVDIYDIVKAAGAYGSRVGDPDWNPLADLAPQYGKIDIYDLVTCASHYGETYP